MTLDRLFDRFLPVSVAPDPQRRHRARLLYGVASLGLAFGTVFALFYLAIGHYQGAAVILTCQAAMIGAVLLVRFGGRVEAAAHCTVLIWILGFSILAVLEGGLNSHAVAWLIGGVPMVGWLVLPSRAALLWTGVAVLALLGFCGLNIYGYELQPVYADRWRVWVSAGGYAALALFLAAFGAVFESSRRAADQRVSITGEKLSDMQARFSESERFIRRIADCTPGLIYLLNLRERKIEFANARLMEALGRDARDTSGIDLDVLDEALVGGDVDKLLVRLRERLAAVPEGAVVETEYELDRGGEEWHWDCRDTVFSRDARGQPETVLGLAEDVTARRLTENAVRASEARFRELFENSPESIFVYNLDGYVLDVNEAACQLHACSREHLLGKHITDLVTPDTREQIGRDFPRYASGELRAREGTTLTADGREIPVMVSTSRIYHQDQPALLVHARDIREVRELSARLLQSQKMEAIGRLAGGVAHDFNNLLTAIIGYNELIKRSLAPGDEMARFSGEVSQAAERAAQLTHQLLAFSRQQKLLPEVMNLNEAVNRIEMMLRRLIGESITLSTRLEARVRPVLADVGQIEQVIVNLVVNARDAIPPEGGSITIRTFDLTVGQPEPGPRSGLPPGDWVVLAVKDSGVGMSEEVVAHIFEPFFTTKAEGKGTGLGLATCYGIVQQSGGHLIVDSTPGEGSVFEVCLPASREALPASGPARDESLPPSGSERLLVVEDRAEIREMLHEVLHAQGYRVWLAEDGQHALEVLERDLPMGVDLLVTDVVMPRMLGSTLAQKFHRQYPETPVLFCSGTEINEQAAEAMKEGWAEFLSKPFTPSDLAGRVRRLIDHGVDGGDGRSA